MFACGWGGVARVSACACVCGFARAYSATRSFFLNVHLMTHHAYCICTLVDCLLKDTSLVESVGKEYSVELDSKRDSHCPSVAMLFQPSKLAVQEQVRFVFTYDYT